MLSCYFRALRLGGVLTSPQAAPSGLQMTPPSLPGMENPGKPGSPDFILIVKLTQIKRHSWNHTCQMRWRAAPLIRARLYQWKHALGEW